MRMEEKISRYYIIYLFIYSISRIVKLSNNSCLIDSDIVCSHCKHDMIDFIVSFLSFIPADFFPILSRQFF